MYERVFNWGINHANDNYERQVAELCPGIYQEGWIACLVGLDISAYHPALAKAALEVELLDFLDPYLPFILPNFNEEEYMN